MLNAASQAPYSILPVGIFSSAANKRARGMEGATVPKVNAFAKGFTVAINALIIHRKWPGLMPREVLERCVNLKGEFTPRRSLPTPPVHAPAC